MKQFIKSHVSVLSRISVELTQFHTYNVFIPSNTRFPLWRMNQMKLFEIRLMSIDCHVHLEQCSWLTVIDYYTCFSYFHIFCKDCFLFLQTDDLSGRKRVHSLTVCQLCRPLLCIWSWWQILDHHLFWFHIHGNWFINLVHLNMTERDQGYIELCLVWNILIN